MAHRADAGRRLDCEPELRVGTPVRRAPRPALGRVRARVRVRARARVVRARVRVRAMVRVRIRATYRGVDVPSTGALHAARGRRLLQLEGGGAEEAEAEGRRLLGGAARHDAVGLAALESHLGRGRLRVKVRVRVRVSSRVRARVSARG